MKKSIIFYSILFSLLFSFQSVMAQATPPATHGAPIGGGLFILLGLGAAYGGKKWYDHRKTNLEE
ncbi:hypothetical protein LA303_03100 [Candidatus Sulfidibacterium hydrothermale]|uniref:hypothetical protein n=1 Tax=Candidatus Sulfidibacterium hydrothermale TaxID=2875962 RepID=UPI001F0B4A8C|nr:hypothetical protein [Candidatus Sulfidibacterium hydrothermale]UBM62973.1 hypothetical protein LA303_03100 [Candidatus Sulfidibacterium hydrothermale]